MSDTDLELLARYIRHRAEDAFAELVRRHLGLVHSAALRQVRSPQLAEEVAQSTFLKLAQHARQLAPDTILSAWLYQVTRREAIDVVRREARRQLREQIATEMNAMNATAADWTHIEPLLDEAMHALDETDRAAVLLRYFENKSLREVGQALGGSENAAQKRLTRAVDHLREFFAKRGVTVGASGLVVVISTNAVQAAPAGLSMTISTAATLASNTVLTTATATTAKTIVMTALQKNTIIVLAALIGLATLVLTVTNQIQHRSEAVASTAPAASPNRGPTMEVLSTLAGSWRGHLEYLDFQDDKTISRLPVTLNITESRQPLAGLAFEYLFQEPGGQQHRSTDLVTSMPEKGMIHFDGAEWSVVSPHQDSPGKGLRFVAERESTDNNRRAKLRVTVELDGENLTMTKTVQYDAGSTPFVRNSFSLVRAL